MTALVPKFADGANDFLAELLIDLIQGDPGYIQHMESRLDELEKSVLDGETSKFIGRMSVVRKELNRNNRMYAQLSEFAESLQEDASELFDISSSKRLSYFLRRAEHLRSETQMLREYATQICSEYQAQVDIVQNRVMKLLTIVTTIFMPLSLIAGWYGMNFSNMPELQWTYGRRDRSRSAHRRGAHHMVQAQEMAVTRAVLFRAGARDLNFTCSPYVNYHKKGIL